MNVEIGIEVYRGSGSVRQGLQFDVSFVTQRLFEVFPQIEFEEEYFQRQIELVRQISEGRSNKSAVGIAIRDAEERGPHFRFRIHPASGSGLRGGINRYCLAFRFDEGTVDQELKRKADEFLAAFTLNRFQNNQTGTDGAEGLDKR